jgi:glycosyltransferase involved in cell wall biosynthesis
LLISNGVDLAVFKPRPIAPLDGPLRILCVGRLIERKGQGHLINAVKKLTDDGIDVRLDLVGTGDARGGYEALSQRLNLTDRVHFLGYVPREKIAERYNVANVFVLPSYNEGMSVALLEAMASGLAVVVTPTGGTSELVETEIHGLVFDWGDVQRLTAHLRRLSQDRLLVQRMGEASRRRAEDFSWDRAVVRYLDLVKQFGITVPATGASVDAEAKHQA